MIPICNTGLVLVLLEDGTVFIERTRWFAPTFDYSKEGITGVFDHDGFSLMEPDEDFQGYDYGVAYPYSEIPVLKQWLVQQQLILK